MGRHGDVLELRVHGVSNTPPQSMLDLPTEAIEEKGDAIGGFWRPRPEWLTRLTEADPGWVPPGVEREAYSWGGMARTTVAAPGLARSLVSVAARIGWVLLLPLGLANVAFWSRVPAAPRTGGTGTTIPVTGHRRLRVFALVLTLVYTLTLVEVLVDLVAVQCMATRRTCTELPSQLDVARSWTTGQRAAAAVVLVLLLLGGLAWLSLACNVRYERVAPPANPRRASAGATHLLSDLRFWDRPRTKLHLLTLHLCGAAAVMVLTMAWDWNFRAAFVATGDRLSGLGTPARVGWVLACASAAGVLGYVVWYLCRREKSAVVGPDGSMRETDRPQGLVVVASVVMTLLTLGLLVWQTPVRVGFETRSLPGVETPSVMSSPGPVLLGLVAVGLALAGSAWSLRTASARGQVAVTLLSLLVVGAVAGVGVAFGTVPALACGIVVAVVALLAQARARDGAEYAFAGRATSVFMLLSLGFAVLLSSAATLAVGDWLNGCYTAADLTPGGATGPCAQQPTDGSVPADLTAPAVAQMAGALVIPCLLLGAVALAAWFWANRASRRPVPAEAPRPGLPPTSPTLIDERVRARRTAALLSRGEPLVAVLAGVVLVNLVLAVGLASSAEAGHDDRPGWLTWLVAVGTISTTFLVLALVSLLIGGAGAANRRPLGLVWDLVCFLPRDGHPFSPPCYAERAVPELTSRVLSWLDEDGKPRDRDDHRRTVILAGHSLGGVLCVAALLQLHRDQCARTSFLTFGCQLQAYFGRIFPALLGPQVLGVPAVSAPPFWDVTRVARDLDESWGEDAVRARLGGRVAAAGAAPSDDGWLRWRNLWRATDPLGFPVDNGRWLAPGQEPGPVDLGCDELDTWGYMPQVDTHGDYPRTPEYRAVLRSWTPTADPAP